MLLNSVRFLAVSIQAIANWLVLCLATAMFYQFFGSWLKLSKPDDSQIMLPSALAMLVVLAVGVWSPILSWWLDIRVGARKPSAREKAQLDPVIAKISQYYSDFSGRKMPSIRWAIIDQNDLNAMAYGRSSIAITRGLLNHANSDAASNVQMLEGIVAHELGHIRHGDTMVTAAMTLLGWPLHLIVSLLNLLFKVPLVGFVAALLGGIFVIATYVERFCWFLLRLVVSPAEYRADRFACELVGREGLLQFFDAVGSQDVRSGVGVLEHYSRSHPPTELRRNRIEAAFP